MDETWKRKCQECGKNEYSKYVSFLSMIIFEGKVNKADLVGLKMFNCSYLSAHRLL